MVPLVDVAPGWPSSPALAARAATAVLAAWLGRRPGMPADVGLLVRGTTVGHRQVVHQTSQIEERRLVWKEEAALERRPPEPAPVDAASFDAWSPPDDLADRSRHAANCRECATRCDDCRGVGRLRCPACDGGGTQASTARAGRTVQCARCKGKRDVDCPACVRRSGGCRVCDGTATVERWLEVVTRTRVEHRVADDGLAPLLPWAGPGRALDRAAAEDDGTVVASLAEAGAIAVAGWPAAIDDAARARVGAAVQPALRAGERVSQQALTVIDVPVLDVTYGLGRQQRRLELIGLRLLAPVIADEPMFRRRATHLRRVLIGAVALPTLVGLLFYSMVPAA